MDDILYFSVIFCLVNQLLSVDQSSIICGTELFNGRDLVQIREVCVIKALDYVIDIPRQLCLLGSDGAIKEQYLICSSHSKLLGEGVSGRSLW